MRKIIDFNRKWAFTKMADAVPKTMPTKWDIVNLPHSWNAIDGQDGDNDYYRGTCYYAKQFMKGSLPEADRYYLEINSTSNSYTYINWYFIHCLSGDNSFLARKRIYNKV